VDQSAAATYTDGTGTTNYTSHPFGQLGAGQTATVDGPLANDTISYAYDELGRLVSRTLNGVTSTWSFDQQGRVTSQGDPIGTFGYVYDGSSGRTATLTYPNGQTTTYAYLPNSGDHRLQQIHHKQPGGATLNKFDYTYDVVGNIKTWTQQTDANPAQVYDLGYDPADQLTAATLETTGQNPTVLKRYYYAYDPAGNRTVEQIDDAVMGATHDNMNRLLSQQPGGSLAFRGTVNEPSTVTIQGQPAAVDAGNQFTGSAPAPQGTSNVVVAATDPTGNVRTNTYQITASGATRSFIYDANGSLSSRTEGSTTTTYEWDADNRLLAVKQGANTLASFTYDANGRRATKAAGGNTTSYVYDGSQFLEERPGAGVIKRHVYAPGVDQVVAEVVAGVPTYTVADHLGSVVRMADATGLPTLSREYDPWGNLLQGSANSGYAFTGREWDPEAELYYYRARYYDPKLARFLTTDTVGPAGRYAYVGNNPVAFVDPSGNVDFRITTEERKGFPFAGGRTAVVGGVTALFECKENCRGGWSPQFVVLAKIVMLIDTGCPWWSRPHEKAHAGALRDDIIQLANKNLAPVEGERFESFGECRDAAEAARDAFIKGGSTFPWSQGGNHQHEKIDNYWIPCLF